MLILSNLISKASGSVGGITASHNKGGMYLRARATPTNPNTTFQQNARNAMKSLTSDWSNTLTQAQRDAWAVYAANQPFTNRLGESKNIPPHSLYVRCNSPRSQNGLAVIDDAPTTYTLPTFTVTSVSASEATQLITVAFASGDAWEDDGGALLVQASRPQSVGINSFTGPYRIADSIDGNAIPPTSPQTVAVPFPVVEDQKLFLRISATNPDGRLSSAQFFDLIVAA